MKMANAATALAREFMHVGPGKVKENELIEVMAKAFELHPENAMLKIMRLFREEVDLGLDLVSRQKDDKNKKMAAQLEEDLRTGKLTKEEASKERGIRERLERTAAERIQKGIQDVVHLMSELFKTDQKELDLSGLFSSDSDKKSKTAKMAATYLGHAAFEVIKNRLADKENLNDNLYTRLHETTTSLSRHIKQELTLFEASPTVKGKVLSATTGLYLGSLILAENASKHIASTIDSLAPPVLSTVSGLVTGALATAGLEAAAGAVTVSVAGIPLAPFIALTGVAAAPIASMAGKALGKVAGKALGSLANLVHQGIKSFSHRQQTWLNKKRVGKDHFLQVSTDPETSPFIRQDEVDEKVQLAKERDFFASHQWELLPSSHRKPGYYTFNRTFERQKVSLSAEPKKLSLSSNQGPLPKAALDSLCEGVLVCFKTPRVKVEASSLIDLENFIEQALSQGLEITQAKYYDEHDMPVILDTPQCQNLVHEVKHKLTIEPGE